ncbi:MAG: DUF4430 domain-containing protein [Oscillospiraceae bacterium]|nr:DUF4430 domain-containing protein [Oscillospiraceae bacterium]
MKTNKKLTIILSAVLLSLLATFCTVFILNRPDTETGSKTISFTVIDAEKKETEFEIKTDEEFLANALVNEKIVPTYSADGLYLTFNGITADWNDNESWWCITEEGVQTAVGINDIAIEDGDSFEATYTIGF